jgi:hypothetical protein
VVRAAVATASRRHAVGSGSSRASAARESGCDRAATDHLHDIPSRHASEAGHGHPMSRDDAQAILIASVGMVGSANASDRAPNGVVEDRGRPQCAGRRRRRVLPAHRRTHGRMTQATSVSSRSTRWDRELRPTPPHHTSQHTTESPTKGRCQTPTLSPTCGALYQVPVLYLCAREMPTRALTCERVCRLPAGRAATPGHAPPPMRGSPLYPFYVVHGEGANPSPFSDLHWGGRRGCHMEDVHVLMCIA